jgi:CRP/FNR family transcriptional regulator, cyclic AMP receptor protein
MNRSVASDDLVDRLRGLPLFAGLSDEALRRVEAVVVELEIGAGQTLARADHPGSGMFVIEEGTVVVEGRGEHVIELGPGEFVGELALLVPESIRAARVRAKTDVRCLAIGRPEFEQLLEDEPRIALAMLPVVARRLWRARRAG